MMAKVGWDTLIRWQGIQRANLLQINRTLAMENHQCIQTEKFILQWGKYRNLEIHL